MTQKAFADAVGISQPTVGQVETGVIEGYSAKTWAKVCEVLGVPLDTFVEYYAPGVSVPPPPSVDADGRHPVDIIGVVGAGPGIDEPIADERIFVAAKHRHCVGYRVRGDSMLSDGIHDGDIMIVRADPAPEVGETVVAWLEVAQGCAVKELGKGHTLRSGSPVVVYTMARGDRLLGTLVKLEREYGGGKKKKGKR